MSPILDSIGSVKAYGWGKVLSLTSFESIATATGNGSATSLTFSSIPGTYQHLQIRGIAKTAADTVFYLRFNSDTGTNYSRHSLYGNGTTAAAFGDASVTEIGQIRASDTADRYSGSIIDIHDYVSTTKNKTVRILTGCDFNGSGIVMMSSGAWLNTSAVTSITLRCDTAFDSNSTFALGIKGA